MKPAVSAAAFFTEKLMHWHQTANTRDLPFKGEKDPYKIWLSEIILQQTRAEQGLPYYLKFIEAYPTVKALANTTDDQAFQLWQGLGYYARCRNMLATARHIANDLGGHFPTTYNEILLLKGIGPYTAAAIASFAYGLPHAVVDGNVIRVLARYFGLKTPFDTTEGKKEFARLADELLDKPASAEYNQAIMDHGATICTPQLPKCGLCPVQEHCVAYHKNLIQVLPVRSKRPAVRMRYFHYLILLHGDKIWLRKRDAKDIWQGLYEPFMIEHEAALSRAEVAEKAAVEGIHTSFDYEGSLTQKLTHQLIETRFYCAELPAETPIPGGLWTLKSKMKDKAFPKTLVSFFEKKGYF